MIKSPIFGLIIALAVVAVFTAFGPAEKSLGTNVRVVYLHGVWVWTALVAFILAAIVGLLGLITKRESLNVWSRVLGRTGLVFWITYLPLSIWAMQTNWNGLFLAEPRWRFAAVFAVGGLVLQIGLTLMESPKWASVGNILYALAMLFALQTTESVMHPDSPILTSDAVRIQIYFFGLLFLTLLAAWGVARLWLQAEHSE